MDRKVYNKLILHLSKFQLLLLLIVIILFTACKRDIEVDPVTPPEPKPVGVDSLSIISESAFFDLGNVDIKVFANGNSWDTFDLTKVRDISGNNYGYCHPDVEYFENGFNGYKYWMGFTPYFGSIASSGNAIIFENPTIVASNDGLHWEEPAGITNPIQRTPSIKDGVVRGQSDTLQGYWSDTDLLFYNNRFELFYRGSSISNASLKRICASNLNNEAKMPKTAIRTIVKQSSVNGRDWQPVDILYTSNEPETMNNNDVLSPSFIVVDDKWISYEVLLNKGKNEYQGDDNSYVLQRTSKNGLDYSTFAQSKIVHFESKPWKMRSSGDSPWHIQASYVDGYYFLYIAVGRVKSYTSDDLYFAYSKDGTKFKVYPKPIVSGDVYRSCMFPIFRNENHIEFGSIIGMKSGKFKYRKFNVKKESLKKMVG